MSLKGIGNLSDEELSARASAYLIKRLAELEEELKHKPRKLILHSADYIPPQTTKVLTPTSSPKKEVPISPYSKAKRYADKVGVALPKNWRNPDWWTPEEINRKVKVVEETQERLAKSKKTRI